MSDTLPLSHSPRDSLAFLGRLRGVPVSVILSVLIALLVIAPLLAVFSYLGAPTDGLWGHLVETRLGEYLSNSLILVLGVGSLTLIAGTGTAWLVTLYRFPGRRLFEWLLVLPLAMPAYVLAYTYTDFFQFTGPVQTLIRDLTGWGWRDYWFPDIRSPFGAVVVLAAALFPYVYVAARAAFLSQSVCALEVSRTLGCSPWGMFWRVGFPLARPAIVAGTMFVLMETLADFGAVAHFEVHTFTTGIYRTWYSYGNPAAAAQLASLLLLFVYALLMFERYSQGQRRYAHTSTRYRSLPAVPIPGIWGWVAALFCFLPLFMGFLLPAGILFSMVWDARDVLSLPRLLELTWNTATLGAITCLVICTVAMASVYSSRRGDHPVGRFLTNLALLGYATPGVVIAVGLLIVLGATDRWLGDLIEGSLGVSVGLIFSGTLFAVVYGCTVRFFTVAYSPLSAGLKKIRPAYEDAARTLGARPRRIFTAIHLPMLRGSLLSAGLLVFVDVMKELPATLILRPFNYDTLAVQAHRLASDERLAEAAVPSLVIGAVGLLPVALLCWSLGRESRPTREAVVATEAQRTS